MDFSSIENFITAHPVLFTLLVFWSLAWKGFALWRAAQRNQKQWFVVLLVVNTIGILEILYLYFTQSRASDNQ